MRIFSLICLVLSTFAAPAWAEEVFGRVYFDNGNNVFDDGDGPFPFEVITIRSELGDFELTTLTDFAGEYSFLVPPGTYELLLPLAEQGVVMHGRILQTEAGPLPLPGGTIIVMPGDMLEVDLPVTGAVAPVFAFQVAPNVVGGGVTSNPDIGSRAPNLRRNGGDPEDLLTGSTDALTYLGGVEVTMIRIDADGNPIGLGIGTVTVGGIFTGLALEDGERVRVSVDPDQPALEDFAPVFPTTVEFTYDASQVMPVIEFRFNPVKDIKGCAVTRIETKKKTIEFLEDQRVQILDFTADEPVVLAETRTDEDGNFCFPRLFHGVYTVRLIRGKKGGVVDETVRLLLGDVDPAPVKFVWEPGKP